MFRFFLAMIVLSLCLATGYYVSTFSGIVQILLHDDLIINVSLITWCLFSLVVAWIIILILRLIIFIWHSPQYFSHSAKVRKRAKAHRLLQNGLAELISGHYSKAEKHFVHGGDLAEDVGESSVIYFENAAIAADYLGEDERRKRYLLRARQHADERHSTLTRLNEAEMHVEHGNYDQAIPLLEEIRNQEGKNIKALTLLAASYQETVAWEKAWRILPKIEHYMDDEDYEAQRKRCARGLLKDTAAIESVSELESAWKALPEDIRQEQEMKLLYAGALVENGHDDAADKYLVQEIKKNQDLTLIQAYSQLRSGNFQERLNQMQRWESAHSNDAVFLYAKALIAYKAKAYDKASSAIESSLQHQQSKDAFALWAQILEARHQPEAALAAYRQSVVAGDSISGDLLPAPETSGQKALGH